MRSNFLLTTCPTCKGDIEDKRTIFSVDLLVGVLVIRNVPISVCSKCGEKYITDLLMEVLENIVIKTKKLSNMRAAGSDEKMTIAPRIKFSLEEAMEYIGEDEYVEVTPKFIRLRKILLCEHERKRKRKSVGIDKRIWAAT